MDDSDSFNPQREQEQELLVLQSIFMEEFIEKTAAGSGRLIELRLLEPKWLRSILFKEYHWIFGPPALALPVTP